MNTRLTLIIVFSLFVIASIFFTQSYPPAPSSGNTGQQKQDSAANNNQEPDDSSYHSSNSSPFIPVTYKNLTTVQKTQVNTTDKANNHDNPSASHYCIKLFDLFSSIDWIVLFTAILAGMAIIQAYIFRNQTRYFHRIERAYVFAAVENNQIEPVDNSDYQTITTPIFLQNHGKTPAIINNIRAVLTLEKPEIPIIEETTFPTGLIFGSDKWHRIFISLRISKMELANVEAWNTPLYCCGRIKYRDVFSKEHKTGFCWEYKPHKSRPLNPWIISNNKELNYYT